MPFSKFLNSVPKVQNLKGEVANTNKIFIECFHNYTFNIIIIAQDIQTAILQIRGRFK